MTNIIDTPHTIELCVKKTERPCIVNLCRVADREDNFFYLQYLVQGRFSPLEKTHNSQVNWLSQFNTKIMLNRDENGLYLEDKTEKLVGWYREPHKLYIKSRILSANLFPIHLK